MGERKLNLYEIVAEAMERDIIETKTSGERMPSEQQLTEQYEVSRTVIREALKLLSERGLIDSKVGSGAFVTKPEVQNLSDVFYRIICMYEIDWSNVYDVRCILEVAAAKKAARLVTDAELRKMSEVLKTLKDLELPQEERNRLDFQYHRMIADASGNALLAMLIEAMRQVITAQIELSSESEGAILDGVQQHGNIISALEQHDVEMAGHYMMNQITNSKKFFLMNTERKQRISVES